jgi:predicted transposase YbfD/YdcC
VLDTAFNEEQCRIRAGHAAENIAIIRRLSYSHSMVAGGLLLTS